MKDREDEMYTPPGIGWIRVDGSFTGSTGVFSSAEDTFLWYRPAKSRSTEALYVPPTRGMVGISEEVRAVKILTTTRLALRHHVDLKDIKRVAKLLMESDNSAKAATNEQAIRSERIADYTALYHTVFIFTYCYYFCI